MNERIGTGTTLSAGQGCIGPDPCARENFALPSSESESG